MKVSELLEDYAERISKLAVDKDSVDHLSQKVVDLIQQKLDKGENVFWKTEKMVVKSIRRGEPERTGRTTRDIDIEVLQRFGGERKGSFRTVNVSDWSLATMVLKKWAHGWAIVQA